MDLKTAKSLYDKQYRARNLIKRREQNIAWQKLNSAAHNAANRRYRIKNKGTVNSFTAKRKASKLNRTPKWLSKEQETHIKLYYGLAKLMSDYLGQAMEVDHIVPLQGKNVSGLHVPWNLQVMSKVGNCQKKNKLEFE